MPGEDNAERFDRIRQKSAAAARPLPRIDRGKPGKSFADKIFRDHGGDRSGIPGDRPDIILRMQLAGDDRRPVKIPDSAQLSAAQIIGQYAIPGPARRQPPAAQFKLPAMLPAVDEKLFQNAGFRLRKRTENIFHRDFLFRNYI